MANNTQPGPNFKREHWGDNLHVDKEVRGQSAHVYEHGKRVGSHHGPEAHQRADMHAATLYGTRGHMQAYTAQQERKAADEKAGK